MISETYNMDCREYMSGLPDNAFELAIVDPPYGAGDLAKFHPRKKGTRYAHKYQSTVWNVAPSQKYFTELNRVSVNQIIWGANYFASYLKASRGWVFWDKGTENTFNFAHGELAFTSFDRNLQMLRLVSRWIPNTPKPIHPCSKPVALYKWLLQNYAKEGDKILDTHLGSGSSRIAAYDLGFDFVGCELDKDYFEAQEKRFANHIQQPSLLEPEKRVETQAVMFA